MLNAIKRRLVRPIIAVLALLSIPIIWFGLKVLGFPIPFRALCSEWKDHKRSGEAWGVFDKIGDA